MNDDLLISADLSDKAVDHSRLRDYYATVRSVLIDNALNIIYARIDVIQLLGCS